MDFKLMAQENLVLKIRVGSHLFGTSTPDSDEDYTGIFMPCDETIYGFQTCNEVDLGVVDKDDTGRNTKDAIDFKVHDYRKFMKLAIENNPNILNAMFVNRENILFADKDGFAERMLAVKARIVHKGAYERFIKYADAQKHKMRIKPQNYAALENGLGFLEDVMGNSRVMAEAAHHAYQLSGPDSPFKDGGEGKHIRCGDLSFERGVFVKKAKKMIRERLSRATNRHVLYTKYGYDTKFGSNLIHMLKSGKELMETGKLEFPLSYAQDIIDVKNGKYTVEEIDKWSDDLLEEARQAYEKTDVRAVPEKGIEKFVMKEIYRWSQLNTKLSRSRLRLWQSGVNDGV